MTARGNPSAVSVQPLVDYQLLISFEKVGSVEWPDEQDVCPDCLYENSTPLIQGMNPPASAI